MTRRSEFRIPETRKRLAILVAEFCEPRVMQHRIKEIRANTTPGPAGHYTMQFEQL